MDGATSKMPRKRSAWPHASPRGRQEIRHGKALRLKIALVALGVAFVLFGPARQAAAAGQSARAATPGHKEKPVEGWTVRVSERLIKEDRKAVQRALALLRAQLKTIAKRVPTKALAHLRTVPLWFSPLYEGTGPKAEYHPAAGWLRKHGRDPAMAKAIEFTNIGIFEKECKRMPMFVLHELAHAYHDQVFGFNDPEIKAAYERAVERGGYDAVKNHAGKTMRAYAMTNPMEYFAELTESFFGQNDFFPFNAAELRQHDPEMYVLLERIWDQPKAAAGEDK